MGTEITVARVDLDSANRDISFRFGRHPVIAVLTVQGVVRASER